MTNGGDAKHFRHNSKAGWPYMSHRIFIQHGLNLWNVGMMACIGAWAIAAGERRMWLLCLPAWKRKGRRSRSSMSSSRRVKSRPRTGNGRNA